MKKKKEVEPKTCDKCNTVYKIPDNHHAMVCYLYQKVNNGREGIKDSKSVNEG